jgi:serine phosphatase RsbU (regulator of sigma subunit)
MLLGGLGRSGESYLVSPDGLMLTRSRFYSSLADYGLVKASDESLQLKDPGSDLVAEHHRLNANGQNKRVKSNRLDDRDIAGEQSFTVMVERLLDGKTHSFEETDSPENFTVWIASAYRDYRGVSVLGVGRWLTNLNLGLVTEIDRMVASGLLSITIGQRATRFMMRAKDELELKVQERTSELNDTLHDLDHSLKVQESQNKELKTLYDHVTDAHSIITSSIGYATRIQNSILPKSEAIDSFIDDYFVIWEPRDNVGGDMYWYQPWGLGKLFALGDCTGHGVPGAFMTMIANGAIEMSTLECMPGDTASLLNRTHQLIQTTLGQDEQGGESNDGLEMGVCYIPHDKSKLVFSGARFSLFIVREGEISEVKGDKRGLGYRHIAKDASFTKHEIDGLDACSIYMTTDGLLDQVGGEKRRAYGKRRFMALLAEIQDHPMASQIDTIKASLVRHQGDEIRRDDVAVIGFKLNGKSS